MAQKNTLQNIQPNQPQEEPKTFSKWLAKVENKTAISSMIIDPNEASQFIGNISSAVAVNPLLQDCSFPTIVSAGLLANSLKLSLSPSIGQCYIVPFDDKKNKRKVATFIIGWKGYLQLAQRSGYYEKINLVPIKEGEIVQIDRINEVYLFNPIEDDEEREKKPTVGYYTFFKYNREHGGFTKALYWSKKKMLLHADKYSKAFNLNAMLSDDQRYSRVSYEDYCAGNYPKADAWKYSSHWYTSFDDMALKTMIRQLIGKWGIMSVEFQKAYEADNTYNDDMTDSKPREYIESDGEGSNIIIEKTTDFAKKEPAEVIPQPSEDNVTKEFFDEVNN